MYVYVNVDFVFIAKPLPFALISLHFSGGQNKNNSATKTKIVIKLLL